MKCRLLVMLGCICLGARGTLRAQTQMPGLYNWIGGSSGSASDPNSWINVLSFDPNAPPQAPSSTDSAIIQVPSGDVTVMGGLDVFAATINGMNGDGTAAGVTMEGPVTLGQGMVAQYATFDGAITAPGINVGPNTTFNAAVNLSGIPNVGDITLGGLVNFNAGSSLNSSQAAIVFDGGIVNFNPGSTATLNPAGNTGGHVIASSALTMIGSNINVIGSTLTLNGTAQIGLEDDFRVGATASITLATGGRLVTNDEADLGVLDPQSTSILGGAGTVSVMGSGSIWQANDDIVLGDSNVGFGFVFVQNGGTLQLADGASIRVGAVAHSFGGLTFDTAGGATPTLTTGANGQIIVGDAGIGTLSVENGAIVIGNNDLLVGNQTTGSGTVTVEGEDSTYFMNNVTVGVAGTGKFTVKQGGSFTGGTTIVGQQLGSMGTITVTDENSQFQSADLTVGDAGGGILNVQQGGQFMANNVTLGSQTTGVGLVFVTAGSAGDGTQLSMSGTLTVGDGGSGILQIQSGGSITGSSSLVIANQMNSIGTVTVTDPGSSLTTGAMTVGVAGTGLLQVQNGANVVGATTIAGQQANGTGTITVTGTGTQLQTDDLTIGSAGNGTLTVSANATLSTQAATIGDGAASVSTATVTDTGTLWHATGDLTVGGSGNGTLMLQNGATLVVDGDLTIAKNENSVGAMTIDGASTTFTYNGSDVAVGSSGTGSLTVQNGAAVNFGGTAVNVGDEEVGTGTLTVTGDSTSLDTGDLTIGAKGTGTMIVQAGASLLSGDGAVGDEENSNGTVTVDNATWTVGSLTVGGGGTGQLTIQNGGSVIVNGSDLKIGDESTGNGTLIITGAGSKLFFLGEVDVGEEGSGTLAVQAGATFTAFSMNIGDKGTGNGTLNIDGSGTSVEVQQDFNVGESGTGTLNVTNGANLLNDTDVTLADLGGSSATVTVAGSTWNIGGDLSVGHQGIATLTISTGSSVTAHNVMVGETGGSGGTITITGLNAHLEASTLQIGGSDKAAGGGGQVILANGGTAHVATTVNLWSQGSLDVTGGALTIGATSSLAAMGSALINSGGVLTGDGSVTGNVINKAGLVSPSHSPGTLSIAGDYTQNAGGTLEIPIAGNAVGQFDVLNVTGNVTLGGLLELDFLGGFQPQNGQVFDLLNFGSLSGQFANVAVTGVASSFQFTLDPEANTLALIAQSNAVVSSEFVVPLGPNVLISGVTAGQTIHFVGGTLESVGNTSLSNAVFLDVNGGVFQSDPGTATTLGGTISGPGALTKSGSGTLTLTSVNTYAGGTTINSGTLAINNPSALGTGDIISNAGLLSTTNVTLTNPHITLGAGSVTSAAAGTTLTLNPSASLNMGSAAGGNVVFGSAGNTGVVVISTVAATNLSAASTLDVAFGTLRNGGSLGAFTAGLASTKVDSGATLDVHDSPITVNQLLGSGAVTLGVNTATVLTVNSGTFGGVISGAGQLDKETAGTLILAGANTYTGPTVVNAGTLTVNGSLATASTVTVNSGATLAGSGTVGGAVSLASGAHLTPGAAAAPGTLTVGSLVLNAGSDSTFRLAQIAALGGVNDQVNVTGNLTLGGTLNVTPLTGFGVGSYSLFTYGGTLTNNGFAAINGLAGFTTTISIGAAHQVNLIVSQGVAQFWDGTGTINDGVISGGAGTWNTTTKNWTDAGGATNTTWQNGTAVFENPGGTVTLSGTLNAQSLIFGGTGYVISGTALNLTGVLPTISVSNPGTSATISAKITGTTGLTASGAGTLILSNASNSFTGGTTISSGTLQIGSTAAGSIVASNAISISNGGTLSLVSISGNTFANSVSNGVAGVGVLNVNSANSNTLSGTLTDGALGQLALTQSGAGTTILTNAGNTFTGATTVSKGVLQIGTSTIAGSLGAGSAVSVGSSGTLTAIKVSGNLLANNITNGLGGTGLVKLNSAANLTLSGILSSGAGALALTQSGAGTTTLTGNDTYTGATTVSAGALQIGDGSHGNLSGASTVTVSGTGALITDLGNASTFAPNVNLSATGTALKAIQSGVNTLSGVISGTGVFDQNGSGTTILTGTNTYTGLTNVNAGTLRVNGSLATGSTVVVSTAGTLSGQGIIHGKATLTGNGTFDLGASGTIGGALGITGGNWTGDGTVTGLVTSSLGVFTLGGDLTAPGGLAVTGGTITGAGTLTGSLNYTSATSSFFAGTIAGTGAAVTMNKAASTLTLTGTNSYTGATTVSAGTLQLGNGTATKTTLGTGAVTVSGTGILAIDLPNASSFTPNVNLSAAGATLKAIGSHTNTISGVISGTGGFTQAGTGITILANNETYSGATNVAAGILEVDDSLAAGSTVNVGTDGTLRGTGTIHGKATLTGGGTINFSPAGNILGTLQVTGGNWDGQGKVVGLVTSSGAGQTFTIDGNLTAALGVTVTAGSIAGTGTLDGILNYMSSTNSTFAGVIANTVPVSTLTMNKAGAILTLTGANTYSGVTNVTAGTLQIGNGGSTGRLGTGNVVDNGILAFDWSTASTTVANAISGTGALNQIGSGTTILNGTETYTGATNVIAGTLEVDSSLAAGSTVNVATGGKLTGTGTIHGKATMTGNGSIDLSSGAVIAGTLAVTGGNWTGQGTVGGAVTSSGGLFTIANGATLTATAGLNVTGGTLAGPGTLAGSLNYTSSASSSFNGNIVDGLAPSSLTMNKAGSTLTLSGTYTYTGPTTITSGTLFLGDTALGNTAVTVNSGGILAGGAPVAGPVTVNSGGTLSVGASTFASTMTTGPLTLKTGAKVDYLLGAAGAIGFGTNDLTDVNGNLALAGTLNLTAGFGFGAGNTYELFSYIGTATGALTLGTLPAGFTASNFTLTNNTAAKEITLTVTGGPVAQYWNGPVTTANNAINGGSGTWDNITTNWTNSSGATNTAWAQSIAVFSTGSGIVTTGDNLTVAALGFVPGTGQYTVNVSPNNTLTITGAGVSNTSGQAQSIVNVADGSGAFGSIVFKNSASASTGNSVQYTNQAGAAAASITFQNSSTAGNAAIINSGGTIDSGSGGSITFQNSSTAGNATISNNGGTVSNAAGAIIFFQGTSTAGSARITNNGGTADSAGGAITSFSNTATAGTATIVVNGATVTNGLAGTIIFNNSSTAGHATIIANGSTVAGASGGFLSFSDTSTAGNASITTNGASASGSVAGVTAFSGSSTAGAATLITTGGTNGGPGGITLFQNTADGGTAQALTNGNGSFDISNLTSAGMKIGSIAGSGTYNLGAKTLTVGGNNLSTVVSGNITDAGDSGSLVKTGTGTLTLSGPNSYTGSTTVNAGILQVGNGSAGNLASASVAVTGTATLVTDLAAASTFTPSVALNAATTALKATQSGTNTLSGVISGSGVFDQTGPGTTILTKTETYTGATNVTAGTLQIGNGTSGNLASASAVTVSGSATLATDLAIATFFTSKVNLSTSASSFEALQFGSDFINGVISGPGSFNQNGSGTTIFTGVTQAYTGPTNVNSGTLEVDTGTAAGSTVNVGTNGTLTGAGKILGKATLTGNGTIKLAASASIAGPLSVTGGNWANVGKVTGLVTASSGTFDVTGDLTASGGVAVSGGTLAGSGTVTGAVTLNNNGTVAPGAATPGAPGTTLHATSMTWNSGGTITLQLGSSANDVLALTGALTKGSAGAYTLDILDDGGIPLDSYTLATFASTTFLATSFTLDMPTGYVGHLVETKTSLTLDVTSGSGQEPGHSESADLATAGNASAMPASTIDAGSSLSITPTPEPGSAMLLIFGGAALLGWRRRQRLV